MRNPFKIPFFITALYALALCIYQLYNITVNLIEGKTEFISTNAILSSIFLLISILALKIDQDFQRYIDKSQQAFRNAVKQANLKETVTHIGSPDQAMPYILEDATNADEVINTYLAIRERSSLDDDMVLKVYESFFTSSKSKTWKDVVGLPELFQRRYELLNLPEGKQKRLEIRVLRHSAPIINFIQFRIGSTTRTYFGWVAFNHGKNDIFFTEETVLNRMFRNHYEKIFEAYQWYGDDSIIEIAEGNVQSEVKRKTDIVDKIGYWLTIEAVQSPDDPDKYDVISYGLINISFTDDNVIEIIPKIYDLEYRKKKDTKHIKAVKNYYNKLYFDFNYASEDDEKINGLCVYNFDDQKFVDTISGYLHNYKTWSLSKITGIRITAGEYDRYSKIPEQIADKIDEVFKMHNKP